MRRHLGLAIAFASIFVPVPTIAGTDAQESGRLRGEARTEERRPVAGATVLAVRSGEPSVIAMTATDPNGFIAIDGIPAGDYRLLVTGTGYGPGVLDAVRVGGPFRSVVDLVMVPGDSRPAPLTVRGGDGPGRADVRVTDAAGRPLAGVELRLEPLGHRHDPVRLFTDAEGVTAIEGIGAGTWRLVVRKTGWTRLRVPILDWDAGMARLLVRMLPQAGRERPAPADLLPEPGFLPPSVPLPDPLGVRDAGDPPAPAPEGASDSPGE